MTWFAQRPEEGLRDCLCDVGPESWKACAFKQVDSPGAFSRAKPLQHPTAYEWPQMHLFRPSTPSHRNKLQLCTWTNLNTVRKKEMREKGKTMGTDPVPDPRCGRRGSPSGKWQPEVPWNPVSDLICHSWTFGFLLFLLHYLHLVNGLLLLKGSLKAGNLVYLLPWLVAGDISAYKI